MARSLNAALAGAVVALHFPQLASAQQVPVSVEDLRRGGYVFLFQHAHVEVTPENQPLDPADCAAQRTLTTRGRADAAALGEAFRALRIPVGPVLASPYCRTLETGRIAFTRAEASEPLLHSSHRQPPGAPPVPDWTARFEASRRLLATPPPSGTNAVLITHGSNVLRLAGTEAGFAGGFIFRPDGRGGAERVAVTAHWFGSEIRPDAPLSNRAIFTLADLVSLARSEALQRPSMLPPSGMVGTAPLTVIQASLLAVALMGVGAALLRIGVRGGEDHRAHG